MDEGATWGCSAGFIGGRIGRSAVVACLIVIAWGSVAPFGSVSSGDETFQLFVDDLEGPFLSTTLDTTDAPDSDSDIDPVDARFLRMQRELDELKASLELSNKRGEAADSTANKPATPAPVVYPTVKLTGFFQADAGWFHQNAASLAMPQLGNVQDDRDFRRTRLAAVGKVADNVSYMLEMDFSFLGRPSFMDVWADVSKVPVFGNIRIGQYRQPFGLNELTSVRELTFLERPSMFAMSPFRQIGIGFHNTTSDQRTTWAASAFGANTDPWGNSVGDRGYGMASRITSVLLEDETSDFILHGGLGYSYISPTSLGVIYRNTPEYGGPLGVLGSVPFFVDTEPDPQMRAASNVNLFNTELASTLGPWHAQSELRYNQVRLGSGATAGFPSFYAQTGYILTGEHRPYDKANGVPGRIKPKNPVGECGGIGAWELACRYSMIDLNEGTVTGGEMNNVTFGVNWYLNDHTKFQFNYISSDLNRAPVGDSHTDIFATRCQVDF